MQEGLYLQAEEEFNGLHSHNANSYLKCLKSSFVGFVIEAENMAAWLSGVCSADRRFVHHLSIGCEGLPGHSPARAPPPSVQCASASLSGGYTGPRLSQRAGL